MYHARRALSQLSWLSVLLAAVSPLLGCSALPPTSTPGIVAIFNPAAVPAVVPTPTDLVRMGGKLVIPKDPAEDTSAAVKIFNDYLRTLDGFPPDSGAGAPFSGALDPASLTQGVVVYDATTKQLLAPPAATPVLDPESAGTRLQIVPQGRWQGGHTYVVAVFSWQDGGGLHGVTGAGNLPVLADAAFVFLRSKSPLLGLCQYTANPACLCPAGQESSCHAIVDGLSDDQARQLEGLRAQFQPLLETVLGLAGRTRSQTVSAWSFTISARTFATFDPTTGELPFPTNLALADPLRAGASDDTKVKLPVFASDDARTKATKAGLDNLDGFSTTASVRFPILTAPATPAIEIDPATVVTGQSALLVNLTSPSQPPTYSAQPLRALLDVPKKLTGFAGQVWITPKRPLQSDRTTYAAVLLNTIKDTKGQPLTPAPATVLLTQTAPVFVNGKSAISVLSSAQAQDLEQARLAMAPSIMQLKARGIDPAAIAGFAVFRTVSIVNPLLQYAGVPAKLGVPTAVTIDNVTITAALNIVHGRLTIRRAIDLRGPINPARLAANPAFNEQIPFMMMLPLKLVSPTARVLITQHALTSWRGDLYLTLGTLLSTKGLAILAIDAPYHGSRYVCLASADCNGGTCVQPGANQPGKCSGQPIPETMQGVQSVPGSPDTKPSANLPKRDFFNAADPFAQRDNYQQLVMDLTQVVRVVQDTSPTGLKAQLAAANALLSTIDTQNVGYLGWSLGALVGPSFLAAQSQLKLAVLNAGGGSIVDMFSDQTSMLSVDLYANLGATAGTLDALMLLEGLRWILDPIDPLNIARYVRSPDPVRMPGIPAKRLILQQAGKDLYVTPPWTATLATELGLPLDTLQHTQGINQEGAAASNVSTFFPNGDHTSLASPTPDLASMTAMQNQAATYFNTGLAGQPPTVQ